MQNDIHENTLVKLDPLKYWEDKYARQKRFNERVERGDYVPDPATINPYDDNALDKARETLEEWL